MIRNKKYQKGFTIIEVWLALIIGASILYFSFQQYQSYRMAANAYQLRANVDLIFQAMSSYFQANCRNPASPLSSDFPSSTFTVTLDDLRNAGFLTRQLTLNPLVRQTNPDEGYIMQFNQIRGSTVDRTKNYTSGTTQPATAVKIGTALVWKGQVSVALANTSSTDTLIATKRLLQADCLSFAFYWGWSLIVFPCSASYPEANGTYAVWESLPSGITRDNSSYWLSTPGLKQFTQRYYTKPVIVLGSGTALYGSQQYFTCGT